MRIESRSGSLIVWCRQGDRREHTHQCTHTHTHAHKRERERQSKRERVSERGRGRARNRPSLFWLCLFRMISLEAVTSYSYSPVIGPGFTGVVCWHGAPARVCECQTMCRESAGSHWGPRPLTDARSPQGDQFKRRPFLHQLPVFFRPGARGWPSTPKAHPPTPSPWCFGSIAAGPSPRSGFT